MPSITEMKQQRARLFEDLKALNERTKDRDMSVIEQTEWNSWNTEIDRLHLEIQQSEIRERSEALAAAGYEDRGSHTSLVVSEENLRAHAEAIRDGRTHGAVEERAKLTVATD